MTVRSLTNNELKRYEDFIFNNDNSTPFHTIDWMKLTYDSFGFEPLYLIDEDENGHVEGVMPLFKVINLLGRRLVSLPLRDRGGALYHIPDSVGRMLEYIIDYAKKNKMDYIHIKTDNSDEAKILEKESFIKKNEWAISYLRLDKDFNETRRRFCDKRINWSINKAGRNNLKFEEGVQIADTNKFYSIFLKNRKRLGVPPYSLQFFKNTYNYFIKKGLAKMFFVYKEQIALTTIILFLSKNKAYDVYSASLDEAYKYRANDFQMFNVIRWLCENGYSEFELGADSKYQGSLLQYKQKWGCEQKKLYFYYYFNLTKDLPIWDSDHPRYRIFRKSWQLSPDFLFEKAGSCLIKYLA